MNLEHVLSSNTETLTNGTRFLTIFLVGELYDLPYQKDLIVKINNKIVDKSRYYYNENTGKLVVTDIYGPLYIETYATLTNEAVLERLSFDIPEADLMETRDDILLERISAELVENDLILSDTEEKITMLSYSIDSNGDLLATY